MARLGGEVGNSFFKEYYGKFINKESFKQESVLVKEANKLKGFPRTISGEDFDKLVKAMIQINKGKGDEAKHRPK